MNVEQINEYIDKIQITAHEDILTDEFINLTIAIMKDFDDKNYKKKSGEIFLYEYLYLILFFHKYTCNVYKNKASGVFTQEKVPNHYNPNDKKIHYAATFLHTDHSSIYNFFVVMHENRHAQVDKFYSSKMEDVLTIDPLSIAMLKELFIMMTKPKLYKNNHNSFIMENDANIYADMFLKEFLQKYIPDSPKYFEELNSYYQDEKTDYAQAFLTQNSLAEFKFENEPEGALPSVYEADNQMKQMKITSELLEKYPLLEFIYDQNGRLKTYTELMEDKEKLQQINKDKEVQVSRSSFSNYGKDEYTVFDHIESIYTVIIKTDPMLQIEEYLIHGKIDEVRNFLNNCPQLASAYTRDIASLFSKYLTIENFQELSAIASSINGAYILRIVNIKYNKIIRDGLKRMLGITIGNLVSSDSDELKDIGTLNKEETYLYSQIEQLIASGTITEKEGREYQNGLHNILEDYRNEYNKENGNNQAKHNHF